MVVGTQVSTLFPEFDGEHALRRLDECPCSTSCAEIRMPSGRSALTPISVENAPRFRSYAGLDRKREVTVVARSSYEERSADELLRDG
jgi:hypothetical protein